MNPGNIRFATHAFKAPVDWDAARRGECATLHVRQRGDGTCESA